MIGGTTGNNPDWLREQIRLVRARTQYFGSVTDLNKAQYALLRALGGISATK